MSNDFLQKFIFEHLPVKGCLVRLEQSWKEVQLRAQPDIDVRAMLGQAICAAAILGSTIKFDGTVSLQIQSSGKLRFLLGQYSNQGDLRGIARKNPKAQEQQKLLENPVMSINLEPAGKGTPYQGIVSMDDGSLARALEVYFAQSEQLETRFWLVANQQSCAALMLQRMPGEPTQEDDFERLVHLASTLTDHELLSTETAHLLHLLFNEDTVRLFDAERLQFGCKCSQDRVAWVLRSLGQVEIDSLLEERGLVEVNCEYCGKSYQFDSVDIGSLFADPTVRLDSPSGVH
ncbi:MAG: Hsp33 family molecular chaperone HslO [Xanthomonadales bacterium]|nr:Hsp33 family molecular chaperone HslO [Xanthomonadales bacterium]